MSCHYHEQIDTDYICEEAIQTLLNFKFETLSLYFQFNFEKKLSVNNQIRNIFTRTPNISFFIQPVLYNVFGWLLFLFLMILICGE